MTVKGPTTQDVQMWVVYPPDFDPAKKWPLVQIVHGGPHNGVHQRLQLPLEPATLGGPGLRRRAASTSTAPRASARQFTDSITGDLGDEADDRHHEGDRLACEKQPWIDKNRMAAAGGSYGGYMMAWLNGHTDRFKAMVCHAGVYNWHSMMASDIVTRPGAAARRAAVGRPGEDRQAERRSASRPTSRRRRW